MIIRIQVYPSTDVGGGIISQAFEPSYTQKIDLTNNNNNNIKTLDSSNGNNTSLHPLVWTLGRKHGDCRIATDKSISSEHIRILAPNITNTNDDEEEDDDTATPNERNVISIQNVGKFGSYLIIEESKPNLVSNNNKQKPGRKRQASDNDDDDSSNTTTMDDDNDDLKSQLVQNQQSTSQQQQQIGSDIVPLSNVTKHYIYMNDSMNHVTTVSRIKTIGLNETILVSFCQNSHHPKNNNTHQQCNQQYHHIVVDHNRIMIQCGKLGTTIVITPIFDRSIQSTPQKIQPPLKRSTRSQNKNATPTSSHNKTPITNKQPQIGVRSSASTRRRRQAIAPNDKMIEDDTSGLIADHDIHEHDTISLRTQDAMFNIEEEPEASVSIQQSNQLVDSTTHIGLEMKQSYQNMETINVDNTNTVETQAIAIKMKSTNTLQSSNSDVYDNQKQFQQQNTPDGWFSVIPRGMKRKSEYLDDDGNIISSIQPAVTQIVKGLLLPSKMNCVSNNHTGESCSSNVMSIPTSNTKDFKAFRKNVVPKSNVDTIIQIKYDTTTSGSLSMTHRNDYIDDKQQAYIEAQQRRADELFR